MTRREAKGLLSAVKDRINEVKKFALHGAAYLTVNTFFFMLNVLEGPDGPVVLIPVVLWGVVLGMHWKKVFGRKGKVEKHWEEAMLHEFMYGEEMPEPLDEIFLTSDKKQKLISMSHAKDEKIHTLQRRLENLEAIITSQKWEELEEQESEVVVTARRVEELSKELK